MEHIKDRKILIVDDEPEIRRMIEGFLRKEGFYRIYAAADGGSALSVCRADKPDIAIMDVMLPDIDGFELIAAIRQFSSMPVLFLSARGEDEDRLLGLGLGADDYVVKPFLPRELMLRLMAVLKRVYAPAAPESLPCFQLGEYKIDLELATVFHNEEEIALTPKERGLLLKLYENQGRIVTSDALCQAVWGDDAYSYENTLMVHVRRIRAKIEQDPSRPKYLLTVRGLGYKLVVKE
ncbi:response regulator transcription factor [Paenibacillus alba]|uniref:Response regulator transcription factor n=1 Tax=Paenibacillus alba TaxID=1197127 RepID=A0ABU6FVB5_9BACL|nr:response regulator transcription factor [Paenibacillus alba]MEC0225818.1 response regulator transcription factor [Paenibacillus alba]